MKCESCKKHDDCANGSGLVWPCGAYEPKIITNRDSLRAMSDEELVKYIDCPYDYICPPDEDVTCVKCILEWLQKPAKEDIP